MKNNCVPTLLMLLLLASAKVPLQAQGRHCSTAKAAGNWDYTYTGSILTQNGFVPAAAVGHFHEDAAGNISGSQVRSVGGSSASEDISGTVTINADCTATATINVLINGEVQRTAVLAAVYDTNMNHARDIFESLTLANGTDVPVVLTSDVTRLFPRGPEN